MKQRGTEKFTESIFEIPVKYGGVFAGFYRKLAGK